MGLERINKKKREKGIRERRERGEKRIMIFFLFYYI